MNASSSKVLVIALGGIGLLAVVAAANKSKAAQLATDSDPELTPPGPPTPLPRLPTDSNPVLTPPGPPAPSVDLPPPALENPPSLPVNQTPPAVLQPPSLDAVLQPPSLDPMIEPPGPPIPLPSMPIMPAPLPAAPSSPSMPTFPVTVPTAPSSGAKTLPTKRPFGDQPLDVQAGSSNVSPGAAPVPTGKRTPAQAALDLLAYVTPILAAKRGSELGVKNAPNGVVKAAQLDMNDVPSDGIYGPRTRAKGTALTGKKFPPRV